MEAIKRNMRDYILNGDEPRRILHCLECDAEFSGNAGDYWNFPDNYVFVCGECKSEMELVEKITAVRYR